MEISASFFHSRLGRRMFLLFVISALLPILALFLLSYSQVSHHLEQLAKNHLRRLSKNFGMAAYDRLLLLETELKNIAANFADNPDHFAAHLLQQIEARRGYFRALALHAKNGSKLLLGGPETGPPPLDRGQENALAAGMTLIVNRPPEQAAARIYMILPMTGEETLTARLVAEINSNFLWGMDNREDPLNITKFGVFDENGTALINFLPEQRFSEDPAAAPAAADTYGGHITSRWSIFLKANFHAPTWTVVLAQKSSDFYIPLERFRYIFPLVALLAFWIVLLLSLVTMRKNLGPLQHLMDGTRRLAQGDFATPVHIDSRDEFRELGDSFNKMSTQLADQFHVLSTIEEIGRTVLSHHDTAKVVATALPRIQAYHPAPLTALCLMEEDGLSHAISYLDPDGSGKIIRLDPSPLTENEMKLFSRPPQVLPVASPEGVPSCLRHLPLQNSRSLLMFPLHIKNSLAAVLIQGHPRAEIDADRYFTQVKRLADQVAVGLSNARLMSELAAMNLGTMKALARTVDAKSSWTAGHSERVAALSVHIGRKMGLSDHARENLLAAGLLHDIGKIGIGPKIIDKAGKLTAEEYEVIKTHPALGIQILEPIRAYAPLFPIILHHHEQFDGNGYPHGLAGSDIPLGARILAIADFYDALCSDRPYRAGWEETKVIELIRQEKGRHFDPEVTEAFLNLIAEKERDETGAGSHFAAM